MLRSNSIIDNNDDNNNHHHHHHTNIRYALSTSDTKSEAAPAVIGWVRIVVVNV